MPGPAPKLAAPGPPAPAPARRVVSAQLGTNTYFVVNLLQTYTPCGHNGWILGGGAACNAKPCSCLGGTLATGGALLTFESPVASCSALTFPADPDTAPVCMGSRIKYQNALAVVVMEGLVFVAICMLGVRQYIMRLFPTSILMSGAAGIGVFIAFVGIKDMGCARARTLEGATPAPAACHRPRRRSRLLPAPSPPPSNTFMRVWPSPTPTPTPTPRPQRDRGQQLPDAAAAGHDAAVQELHRRHGRRLGQGRLRHPHRLQRLRDAPGRPPLRPLLPLAARRRLHLHRHAASVGHPGCARRVPPDRRV